MYNVNKLILFTLILFSVTSVTAGFPLTCESRQPFASCRPFAEAFPRLRRVSSVDVIRKEESFTDLWFRSFCGLTCLDMPSPTLRISFWRCPATLTRWVNCCRSAGVLLISHDRRSCRECCPDAVKCDISLRCMTASLPSCHKPHNQFGWFVNFVNLNFGFWKPKTCRRLRVLYHVDSTSVGVTHCPVTKEQSRLFERVLTNMLSSPDCTLSGTFCTQCKEAPYVLNTSSLTNHSLDQTIKDCWSR